MDTITHTLFGCTIYGAFKNKKESKQYNRALLLSSIGASQIPDIDVISQFWDTEGLYQMWHRGITHSVFLTPIWAFLFFMLSWFLFGIKDKRIYFISLLAVFIHVSSDLFNAWGTGYLEPFYNTRITFGTIPIIDFVFWITILTAFIVSKRPQFNSNKVYQIAWIVMLLHVIVQSAYGLYIYNQYDSKYSQVALSAGFIPFHFTVIGKQEQTIDIIETIMFADDKVQYSIQSNEQADLEVLFEKRPEAKTLYEWAPFVVIVDDDQYLGLYDPRFYRDGQSFLFEYIEKNDLNK
ncbi:metal-dependent hydrolase [Bacillus sp. Marseille-P3661]|uniref:metal-dependent hydrolase n=1 Tax=Bacillus sp. Marseille-P3661 TaxID=1936234 RepID=UPI000C8268EF|nr:metal-dependent hydrolase [Bacillus sp. Marseille-P3661]